MLLLSLYTGQQIANSNLEEDNWFKKLSWGKGLKERGRLEVLVEEAGTCYVYDAENMYTGNQRLQYWKSLHLA